MQLKDVVVQTEQTAKEFIRQLKTLKHILNLDKDRQQHITKIPELLKIINPSFFSSKTFSLGQELEVWKKIYEQEVKEEIEREERCIGVMLEQEFKQRDIIFAQKGNAICVSVLLLEWDSLKRTAIIWYGPKKEKIVTISLDPAKIAEKVMSAKHDLGCGLEPVVFISHLRQACNRSSDHAKDGYVPVNRVLAELSFLLQKPIFYDFPSKDNFKNYSRADFSYDLFRVRREAVQSGLQLKTATLAATSKQQTFLWIPTTDSIDGGNHFSGVRFGEDYK